MTVLDIDSLPLAIYLIVGLDPAAAHRQPRPRAGLLPGRDALLRRQLGVERLALPRRQPPKLDRVKRASPLLREQLERFAPAEAASMDSRGMAFRSLHLQGRCLGLLLPKAIGGRPFEEYSYVDGENVAGSVLGWNFGEGHLGDERLLACIQEQCDFEDGEVRAIMVESQPLLGSTPALAHPRRQARRSSRRATPTLDDLARRAPWDYG